MVAPLVAAGIASAAGSIVGGLTGGKGAKKAAQIQAQTTREQIAALERNREYVAGLSAPTIQRGDQAGTLTANFLGMNGGTAAADALATYRGSTGYNDLLKEGLGAVTANAYARGQGDSGAALKRLQERGMSLADRSSGDWLSRLGGLQALGQQAVGNVAGVATNTTAGINAANQTNADAQGNAALIGAAGWQKALQGLVNSGSYALGSSFGGGSGSAAGLGSLGRSLPGYSIPYGAGF